MHTSCMYTSYTFPFFLSSTRSFLIFGLQTIAHRNLMWPVVSQTGDFHLIMSQTGEFIHDNHGECNSSKHGQGEELERQNFTAKKYCSSSLRRKGQNKTSEEQTYSVYNILTFSVFQFRLNRHISPKERVDRQMLDLVFFLVTEIV